MRKKPSNPIKLKKVPTVRLILCEAFLGGWGKKKEEDLVTTLNITIWE